MKTTTLQSSAVRTAGRVAVLAGPGVVDLEERPLPEPGAGQVRVRIEGCGVCGSNRPVWEGRDWFDYPQAPGAPGHEGWGIIDAVGAGVADRRIGERVVALSYHAFAEYDIADAAAVVPVPAELAGMPLPGEPLGCAMNVFRRAAIEPGQTVAILGIGFLGALLTQLCAGAGARVIALSRRPFALDVARTCGAADVVMLDDRDAVVEHVARLTDGQLCERVVECVGLQTPLETAAAITRIRGRLVIAGYHQDGPRTIDMQLWNWRGLDVINAHEREPDVYVDGMHAAMQAVSAGVLDPSMLYTHTFALDELGRALDVMRERPAGFLKAVVTT